MTAGMREEHDERGPAEPERARLVLADAPGEAPDGSRRARRRSSAVASRRPLIDVGPTSSASSSRWRKRLPPWAARTARSSCSTMRPWSNTMTSSTIRSVDSLWAMMSVVRPAMQLGDGGLEALLGDRVDARRRLVEHDEVGLAQPHPGERQQLGLAGRQPGAAGAEGAVDAAVDERRRARRGAARRSTAASVGAGSNSVTLSRIVPSNSSTSWGTRATRRRSSANGMSAIGTPPSDDRARRSPRRGAAAGGRTSSCRCRCGRRRRPSGRRRCRGRGRGGSAARRRRRRRRRRRTTRRGRRRPSAPGGGDVVPASTIVGSHGEQVDARAPSPRWPSAPSPAGGRGPPAAATISSTYWNSRNAVPSVIAPLATSAALTTSASTEPAVTAPCTAHHRRMNARWRRTELCSMPRAVLDEAPHGVHAGAVGAQVLGRREALLDAAVEAGVGAHLVGRLAAPRGGACAQQHGDGARPGRRPCRGRAASRAR